MAKSPAAAPEPTPAPTPAPTAAPAPEPAFVKARVLCDCAFGKVNDVVEVTADEASLSPDLDAHPDAVAYAESLKG